MVKKTPYLQNTTSSKKIAEHGGFDGNGNFRELPQGSCRAQVGLKSDVQYVIFAVREKDYVKRADLAKRAVELCNLGSSQKVELLILDNVDPRLIPIYLNAGNVLLLCSNHEGSLIS
jgi:hypothetical protein